LSLWRFLHVNIFHQIIWMKWLMSSTKNWSLNYKWNYFWYTSSLYHFFYGQMLTTYKLTNVCEEPICSTKFFFFCVKKKTKFIFFLVTNNRYYNKTWSQLIRLRLDYEDELLTFQNFESSFYLEKMIFISCTV
jgi:hypothetical protein